MTMQGSSIDVSSALGQAPKVAEDFTIVPVVDLAK